jgi:hypothetical protein
MGLVQKILNEKIDERINFINKNGYRSFDSKIDIINLTLTPRQYFVLKKEFKLKETQVICCGIKITPFIFNDYSINIIYNNKMDIYELRAKHNSYIEDIEQRENYLDELELRK